MSDQGKVNRILWNRRPNNHRDPGDIDEIVLHNPGMVHIEQMDDDAWWIAIYTGEVDAYGDPSYWMGNFCVDKDGKMTFSEQENNRVKWDRDDSHEDYSL